MITDWLLSPLPYLLAALCGAVLMAGLTLAGTLTRERRVRRAESVAARTQALRAATTIARTVFEARQALWREAEQAVRHRRDE